MCPCAARRCCDSVAGGPAFGRTPPLSSHLFLRIVEATEAKKPLTTGYGTPRRVIQYQLQHENTTAASTCRESSFGAGTRRGDPDAGPKAPPSGCVRSAGDLDPENYGLEWSTLPAPPTAWSPGADGTLSTEPFLRIRSLRPLDASETLESGEIGNSQLPACTRQLIGGNLDQLAYLPN